MRVRSDSGLLQVWVALMCALSAGFSGDLFAHHTGHVTHTARHSRAGGQRSTRGVSRDGYSDHSSEVEVLQDGSQAATAGQHPAPALLPAHVAWIPTFVSLAWIEPLAHPAPRVVDLLAVQSRGPPALS